MRLGLYSLYLIISVLVISITSCKTPAGQAARDLEQENLSKYIARYHPTVAPKASGLYFIETKAPAPGADSIKKGDLVKVYYRGYLIEDDPVAGIQDGYMFDSSGEFEPFAFTVGQGQVIAGWDEGVQYMKDGSEAKLVIPSKLAYAGTAKPTIPAYSPLVFYITMYKVYRSTDVWPTIEIRPKSLKY